MKSEKASESTNVKLVSLVLRVGLAFVFLYAATSALRLPDDWLAYVPSFTTHLVAAKTALDAGAVLEIVIALVLLSGKFVKYAAGLAAVLLAGIVLFNLSSLLITFRDIGLIFMAVSLALLN